MAQQTPNREPNLMSTDQKKVASSFIEENKSALKPSVVFNQDDKDLHIKSQNNIGEHYRINRNLISNTDSFGKKQIDQIVCFECDGIPINPVQCRSCKTVFCAEYFIPYLNINKKCQKCQKPGIGAQVPSQQQTPVKQSSQPIKQQDELNILNEIENDKSLRIQKLLFYCPNQDMGCREKSLSVNDLETHLQRCTMECKYCSKIVLAQNDHYGECHQYKIQDQLVYQFDSDMTRNQAKNYQYIEEQKERKSELDFQLKKLQMKSEQKSIKLFRMKLTTFALLVLAIVNILVNRKTIDNTKAKIQEVSQCLNSEEILRLFEYRDYQQAKIKAEIYLSDILEQLKEEQKDKFDPNLSEDSRLNINQYRDQLSKKQLFEELLSQIVFFNKTLGEIQNNQNQIKTIACPKQYHSNIGRDCFMKEKYLNDQQIKLVNQFQNYIWGDDKAQEYIGPMLSQFLDRLSDKILKKRFKDSIIQFKKLLRLS